MDSATLGVGLVVVLGLMWYINSRQRRVCIVSLVKDPHQFDTWVKHHKGVSKFYIFQDDDAETLETGGDVRVICIKNWKDRLGFKWNPSKDAPANVRVKQELIFNEGQRMALADGMDYIVHIDSDELLLGDPADVFCKYPKATAFHMKNEELAPDRMDYTNCFTEGTKFHEDPTRFTAYGNGKAAGVVGKCSWFGPHYLQGSKVQEVPPEELRVLHYPSCNIQETIKRAKQYGNFQDNSAGWSTHHKETRDVLANCDQNCEDLAREQFTKRMAGPGAKSIVLQ